MAQSEERRALDFRFRAAPIVPALLQTGTRGTERRALASKCNRFFQRGTLSVCGIYLHGSVFVAEAETK